MVMDTLRETFINLNSFLCSIGTTVLITTGSPSSSARKTEVVDVTSGKTCADLVDFPFSNDGAVGAIFHETPVVCGGRYSLTYYRTCYKFSNAGWYQFTSMKENRHLAAGIMHQNKFHVFGGTNGPRLQTSELISVYGVVEYGPELPEAVYLHAITSINSTVSILSGGSTSVTSKSPLTWYFNHETNVFSSGPSLLVGRSGHGSATCVDKVSKAKIPMVAGGYNAGYMPSTELLINGQWLSGTYAKQKINDVLILFCAVGQTYFFLPKNDFRSCFERAFFFFLSLTLGFDYKLGYKPCDLF